MPSPSDYINPYITLPFFIAAGTQSPTDYIRCVNFAPVAMHVSTFWTTSNVSFQAFFPGGGGGFDGGILCDPTGSPVNITIASAVQGNWIALDPRVFGSGISALTFLSENLQANDVHGSFILAPLYTIGIGV